MILRRIEGERFSEVLPLWAGDTCVLIGGGPSLTLEQVGMVEDAHRAGRVRCIAVNDAYLVAPWADVVFAADSHWYVWQEEGREKPFLGLTAFDVRERWQDFAGQRCTIENSGANVTDARVHMLRNKTHPEHSMGLSLDPRALVTGRNSGFQSLNLAVLAGARRVILLGFDGRAGAASHWHGGHPRPTPSAVYAYYRQAMSAAAQALLEAGVEVLNASPGSAIDSFPRVRLEDVL